MARPTLSQISNAVELQTTYRWDVQFIGGSAALFGLDESINLRCQSASLPSKNNEPLEASIRGHKFFQPGISDPSGDLTFTMYETTDGVVADMLKAWADANWAEDTGTQLNNSAIMVSVVITLLNRQDNRVREYHLQNCFLTEYTMPDVDSENTALQPTFTVKYSGFTTARVG